MIQLDISADEVTVLRETLEGVLSDLRYEINNTDSYDYKEGLKLKQKSLERVLGLLGGG
jgi:hypothetical protein